MSAQVFVLKPGYAVWEGYNSQRACGSISLIKSNQNCLVDLGIASDKDLILAGLKSHQLHPSDISFIILTHSDVDHIGNLNLFPNATFIGGHDVIQGDLFKEFFKEKYQVGNTINILHTPGHDDRSLSVLVKTEKGIIAITGDLFEYDKDWEASSSSTAWEPWSKDKKIQMRSRAKIWQLADYIVPGHGDIFKVDKSIDILKS